MKDESRYADLIGRYLSGECSREETASLMAWVNASAANRAFFEDMESVWSAAGEVQEETFEADWESAWEKVDEQLVIPKTAKVVSMSSWRRVMSVAAAILVLVGIGWWSFVNQQPTQLPNIVVSTLENERLEYTLPDSSTVWLNENSRLEYAANFAKREVILEGEAFFDVERMEESPFEIFSGGAKTRVLGTSFNVRAYPKEDLIEVTVESGKVEFSNGVEQEEKRESIILEKGEAAVLGRASKKILDVEKQNNSLYWKTKQYQFDNLGDVIFIIERYFEKEIVAEDATILNCDFTNTGKLGDLNLEILKELIEFQTGSRIQLEKIDGKYILKGEGCK